MVFRLRFFLGRVSIAIFGGYEKYWLGLLVFWLKKESYRFVKPMVGFKAKRLIELVKSMAEIIYG